MGFGMPEAASLSTTDRLLSVSVILSEGTTALSPIIPNLRGRGPYLNRLDLWPLGLDLDD